MLQQRELMSMECFWRWNTLGLYFKLYTICKGSKMGFDSELLDRLKVERTPSKSSHHVGQGSYSRYSCKLRRIWKYFLNFSLLCQEKQDMRYLYTCPVYKTRQRGPTYVWAFNIRTKEKPSKWVLAGVSLLLQIWETTRLTWWWHFLFHCWHI